MRAPRNGVPGDQAKDNCHLCAILCPVEVFGHNDKTNKVEVVNLDACEACGACIENCPTDAILNNFQGGSCACPTCAILNGVTALTTKEKG